MSLTEFLLARIAEDEADARQLEADLARWDRERATNGADGTQGSIVASTLRGGAFDPARVLAECEAKRRIVEVVSGWRHEVVEDCWYTCAAATEDRDGGTCCDDARRDSGGCDCGRDARAHSILSALALPHADHPDYDESWRP